MSVEHYTIKSSGDAAQRSKKLKSCWSAESMLTQRTLIYVASLLEQLLEKRTRAPRKATAWNKHVAKELGAGKTIKEAAASYVK